MSVGKWKRRVQLGYIVGLLVRELRKCVVFCYRRRKGIKRTIASINGNFIVYLSRSEEGTLVEWFKHEWGKIISLEKRNSASGT